MDDLFTAGELLKADLGHTYLVYPIIPMGGRVLFHGKRGLGKSSFALSFAMSILHGGKLFGRYPCKQGPVVYVQVDMSAGIQQERVERAVAAFKDVGKLPLYFWLPLSTDIVRLEEDDDIVRAINEINPVLIVWDTLRQVHSLEDSDIAVRMVYGSAKWLFPTATHMFIHHDKKTVADQAMLDPDEVFHGSGFWLNNADTGLGLGKQGNRLVMRFTKGRTFNRDGEQPVLLKIDPQSMMTFMHMGPVREEIQAWREKYGSERDEELRQHLMSGLMGSPGLIDKVLEGRSNDSDSQDS